MSDFQFMEKKHFKNLTLAMTENLFLQNGIAPERARQIFTWIYERNVQTFGEISIFPKKIMKKIESEYTLNSLEFENAQKSSDGTLKILLRTRDNLLIESVLITNDKSDRTRFTACISSQAGCAMGCSFCCTAKNGFKRNLETAEMLDQISHLRRVSNIKNNNVVFMGMGEPMNNYENVMNAAEIMNYTFGFHISNYRITISTCGIIPGIQKFIAEQRPYNLAISLNDSDFKKRSVNMPVEKKFPFNDILEVLRNEMPVTKNRVLFEYVMREDNISLDDAARLKSMVFSSRILLNCILLNSGDHDFETPSETNVNLFLHALDELGITYTIRDSYGSDIDAACGQLAGKHGKNN